LVGTVATARFTLESAATVAIGPADAGPHGITQGFETGQFSRNADDNRLYYLATELGRCADNAWDSGATLGLWSADEAVGPWRRPPTSES
jgi:hypothetical protein